MHGVVAGAGRPADAVPDANPIFIGPTSGG